MKSTDIKNRTNVTKDFKEKSIVVSREFDAPVEQVWRAFTNRELLDEWWGPSPWRAETKTLNFTPGGYWLYAMVGPDNDRQWGRMNYFNIERYESFEFEDAFCDENGKLSSELPVSRGEATFYKTDNGTRVDFKMTYPSESDLEKIVEMGFEEGITIGLDQLESLLRR
jgi:uncharacterized protein YndB with AHSA1/START domain